MKAVIYVRVSDPRQVEGQSLATQEAACRAYCQRHNLQVDRVFRDEGESAKTADRPNLHAMLAHIKKAAGKVSTVVVYDLSRFARSSLDHHVIRHQLRGMGAELRSTVQVLDDSPESVLLESFVAAIGQYDNESKRRRVVSGMRAAVLAGRWCWFPPIGYQVGMALDPVAAPLIRLAYEMAATGRFTVPAIAAELGRRGLKGQRGETFGKSACWKALRSPVYKGTISTVLAALTALGT